MEKFLLEVADTTPRRYQVTTALRMQVAGKVIEQVEDIRVCFRLSQSKEDRLVFHLKVEDYQQESNQPFFHFASLLNQALDDVSVITNRSGKATRLFINHAQAKHYQITKQLKEKYRHREGFEDVLEKVNAHFQDPQLLLPQINEQGWHRLFFHGFYGSHPVELPQAATRLLPQFVGAVDVPLALTHTVHAPDTDTPCYRLHTEGLLDQSFNHKGLKSWLKTLYDRYDLALAEQVDYEETYQFDPACFLQQAESFFSFQVGGLYQCTLASVINQIPRSDEPKTIRTEWMLSDL